MVGCYTSLMTFLVADDDAICGRIQTVLLAEVGIQFHRRIIGACCHGLRLILIGTSEGCTAGVLDAVRLAHFNADVGVICRAASVPAPMVPRKGLINIAGVGVDEAMHTGVGVAGTIPVLDEHGSRRLRTADGVQHQTLGCDLPPCGIAGVLCQNALNDVHAISS